MTLIDYSKLRSSSLLPGLQDLGSVSNSITYSGTIPVLGSLTTTLPLAFSSNKVLSLIKMNVTGAGCDTYWFPVIGSLGLFSVDHKYFIYVTVESYSGGRQLKIQFVNNTVGSTVTVPSLTFTATAHLFNFPW